jgi:alkyl hydroperoxide reductase subunit AhpC
VSEIRNLHQRYVTDRFALIGISADDDEEAWRDFTAAKKMLWPQYRDEDRKIQRAFRIRAYPTYIIIDHEGILRYQSVGVSYARSANLENAIRQQLKLAAQSAQAQAR